MIDVDLEDFCADLNEFLWLETPGLSQEEIEDRFAFIQIYRRDLSDIDVDNSDDVFHSGKIKNLIMTSIFDTDLGKIYVYDFIKPESEVVNYMTPYHSFNSSVFEFPEDELSYYRLEFVIKPIVGTSDIEIHTGIFFQSVYETEFLESKRRVIESVLSF